MLLNESLFVNADNPANAISLNQRSFSFPCPIFCYLYILIQRLVLFFKKKLKDNHAAQTKIKPEIN